MGRHKAKTPRDKTKTAEIIKLFQAGLSQNEIKNISGFDRGTIWNAKERWHKSQTENPFIGPMLPKDSQTINEIIKLRESGASLKKVGKALNVHWFKVRTICLKHLKNPAESPRKGSQTEVLVDLMRNGHSAVEAAKIAGSNYLLAWRAKRIWLTKS